MNIRYGIIGCGGIAPKFIKSSLNVENCEIAAVAARDITRAEEFASKNCPYATAYGSYEELCADADINAVYIATTHNFHFDNIMLALNSGKHVICEKPITTDGKKLAILQKTAQEKGLMLMEAMWSRFLPPLVSIKKLIDSGELGSIKHMKSDFCCNMKNLSPEHRINDPKLAGGALFDLGIYCLNAAMMLTDEMPKLEGARVELSETGVDETSEFTLAFKDFNAEFITSIAGEKNISNDCKIVMEKGVIVVDSPAHMPKGYTVFKPNSEITFSFKEPIDFSHEIRHFNELINSGATDSPIMGAKHSMMMMEIMDEFRKTVGLKYPFDEEISTPSPATTPSSSSTSTRKRRKQNEG